MQFPSSPTIGQIYTYGSKSWQWTGTVWKMISQSASFHITEVAASVNWVEVQGNVTASPPILLASGSDTDIGFNLSTKGAGNFRFYTNGTSTGTNNLVLQLEYLANTVNFIAMRGAIDTGNIEIQAKGTSTDVGINLITKGAGQFTVNGLPVAGTNNSAFLENSNTVSANYTMPTGKNAVSAGPITINAGITVTIPNGQTWVIV